MEHVKRYTTLGMGTDQGRTSGANGLAVLAAVTGREPGSVGTTTFRPPYAAVRIGAVAHHRQGDLYRPRRRMPAHGAHAAAGAVFDDFGWERPDWYRSNGAVREAAVVREMAAVREAVGVFDGSPLGKIEVGGPDAATFLDRLYVTNVKSLEPGRIRYSLMLREDGVIFDDGVLACLGHNHYLAGPSSGNADAVAAWFERWHQSEWPELRVAIAPVTARWAVVALAGPQARVLLQRLEPDFDISAQALPHMHLREGTLTGYPVRVARVSFTGELQYEISVPARHGRALFENALARGSDLHARPVGLEAWLRLRLEKGYLHLGSDTNGRTTPDDVGMARTARSKRVDFVGRRSLDLPFNLDPNREQLVGLRALDGPLEVGGRILAGGCERPPCATEGYVTSACHSPAVGAWIGLALLQRGRERMDEDVRIWTSGRVLRASVCPPVFLDPENRRLRV